MRGVGYYVKDLKRHLRQILGLDRKLRVAIMGAGNLGLALADYPGFRQEGFEIAALFDSADAQDRPASRAAACRSSTSSELQQGRRAATASDIAVHRRAGRVGAAGRSTRWWPSGIKAVLNFSPGTLQVPDGVKLKSVDLTVSLESLSFFLAQGEQHAVDRHSRRQGACPDRHACRTSTPTAASRWWTWGTRR